MTPRIFTPNTKRHNASGLRFVLYRHSENLFSAKPDGERFWAVAERDDCGAGCMCGAFLTKLNVRARRIIKAATIIDSMNNEITEI